MKEEIRPVIIDGQEIPGYFVSNLGRVWTTLKPKRVGSRLRGFYVSENKTELNPTKKKNIDGSVKQMSLNIRCENQVFDYNYKSKSKTTFRRRVLVHQLVMNSFKPIETNPPDRLKEYWFDLPNEVKKWIAETIYINHIDHDPTNNCVDNLEYCTPRENTRKALSHYGGNHNNKKKANHPTQPTEKLVTLLDFV